MDNNAFKLGFIDDRNNLQFNETFKSGNKLKDIHIEIYPNNPIESHSPFTLFIRTIEKNVLVLNDGNRLILESNNKFKTYTLNILLSDITKCFVEANTRGYSSFVINVKNIWYRITVVN